MISTGTGRRPDGAGAQRAEIVPAEAGWPRIVMNMVGTPEKIVTRSASMSRIASSGSKTSITTWVEPTRQLAATPPMEPKMWKYGTGTR